MKRVCERPEEVSKTGLFDLFVFGVNSVNGYLSLSDRKLKLPRNLPFELEAIEDYCHQFGADADHQKYLLETRGIGKFITLSQDGVSAH